MDFTIFVPNELVELLGEKPVEKIQTVVDKELTRLWHVERSKPRARRVPGFRSGPLPMAAAERRWRGLVEEAEGVFQALRRHAGSEEAFLGAYGAAWRTFNALLQEHNLAGLEKFIEERLWLRR